MAQALSLPVLVASFSAKSDMSTGGPSINSTYRYTAVKFTTVDWECDLAGTAEAFGVLQDAPQAGSAASVMLIGISPMVVDGGAGAIAPGDHLKTDSSGRGVKTTSGGDKCIGVALQNSSATNDIISVQVFKHII